MKNPGTWVMIGAVAVGLIVAGLVWWQNSSLASARTECELLKADMNNITDARLEAMEDKFLKKLNDKYEEHFKNIETSVRKDMSNILEVHRVATANMNAEIEAFKKKVAAMEAAKRDSRTPVVPPSKQPSESAITPGSG